MKAKKKIDYSDPKFNDFIPIPRKSARGPRVSLKKQCALYKVAYWYLVGWVWHRYGIDPPNPFGLGKTKPPAKRGRKGDYFFGMAVAEEYKKRKAKGERRADILKTMVEEAREGRLWYFREARKKIIDDLKGTDGINLLWHAIKAYR